MSSLSSDLKEIFKIDKFLIALTSVQLFFLIYRIIQNNYLVLIDSVEYFNLAKNILNNFEFHIGGPNSTIEPESYTKRPPLYAVFITIFSGFLNSKALVICIQSLLSISSILIIKSIFKAYFGNINNVLLFLFTFSFLNQFIYSNFIMSEIFLQFLIVISMYVLNKLLNKKSLKYLLYYQILVILLFLTKPVFYLYVIPNILLTYLLCKRINLKFGTIYASIPLLVVFLYCQWNYNRTGSYNFSSIQQINLVNYNLKYFHTNKYGTTYANNINTRIREEAQEINNYSKRLDYMTSTAINHIKKDLLSYLVFHAKGAVRIFIDPGRFDMVNFFKLNSDVKNEVGLLKQINEGGLKSAIDYLKTQPLLIIICFNLVLLFNLIKFLGFLWFLIRKLKQSKLIIWIIFGFILYIAGLTGPLGASRFIIPVLPLYLFISLYGISDFISTTKSFIGLKRP